MISREENYVFQLPHRSAVLPVRLRLNEQLS
jgi:hypothetical protein